MFQPAVTDEHDTIFGTLSDEIDGLAATLAGLSEEQARLTPTASALSVGGAVKHVTFGLIGARERIASAPEPSAWDSDMDARVADWTDSFALRDDETVAGTASALVETFAGLHAVCDGVDLGAMCHYPAQPWFGQPATDVSIRWVLQHIFAEVAHHAGHADIVRETIDGSTTDTRAGITWTPDAD